MLDRSDTIEHRSYIEKSADEPNEFKYKYEFLVGKFAPTDFKIKLRSNKLIIEACHETSPSRLEVENFYYYDNEERPGLVSGLGKKTETFIREIDVPDFVDLDSLTCYLETYEGFQNVLVVEGRVDKRSDFDVTFAPDRVKNPPVYSNCNAKRDLSIDATESMSTPTSNINVNRSNQNIENSDRVSSDTFIKYRFDLSDFDSKNIQITIKDKSVLNVSAVRTIVDANTGLPMSEHFNHDIKLPENVEVHNIRNCFDENDGILGIEIPMGGTKITSSRRNKHLSGGDTSSRSRTQSSTKSSSSASAPHQQSTAARKLAHKSNKGDSGDKYLELVFDLYDFKFDRIEVRESSSKENETVKKNILVVRAFKADENVYRPYVRKYILPDWVNSEKMFVAQEKQMVDGKLKNVLVVQIAIKE